MPFSRMQAALQTATIEASAPQQFSLSRADYAVFAKSPHPLVKASPGQPPTFTFAGVPVVEATEERSRSVLHVLGSLPVFTNPIPV